MQDFLLELEYKDLQDVASTKERFEDIDARLGTVERHLGIPANIPHKASFWPTTLTGWLQIIGIIVAILAATCTAILYLGSLMVDRHIQSAMQPIQKDIQGTTGDVREIKGMISVLRGQIAITKYSTVPPQELKKDHDALATVKTGLASTPQTIPDFWPTSFKIINLLSEAQATSILQTIGKKPLKPIENVVAQSFDPGTRLPIVKDEHVLLRHRVETEIFVDSVIQFDPDVQLVNDAFMNCVFVFPLGANPSKSLQQIGSALLAADLSKSVTIKGS